MFRRNINKKNNRDLYPDWVIASDHPTITILTAGRLGRALLSLNDGQPQRIYNVSFEQYISIEYIDSLASFDTEASYSPKTDEVFLIDKDENNPDIYKAYKLAHELTHRFQDRQNSPNFKFKNGFERIIENLLSEIHAHYVSDILFLQALQRFEREGKNPQYCQQIRKVLERKSLCHLIDRPIETAEDIQSVAMDLIQANFKFFLGNIKDNYIRKSKEVSSDKSNISLIWTMIGSAFGLTAGSIGVLASTNSNSNALYPFLVAIPLLAGAYYSYRHGQSHSFRSKDIDYLKLFNASALAKIPSVDGQAAIEILDFETLQSANGYNLESVLDAIDIGYE